MKKTTMTLIFSLSALFIFAQSGYNPPGNVRESFQRAYPQSKPTQWNRTKVGWSVDFEDRDHNNGEVTAHFDRTGRHLETYTPYDNQDVPAPVVSRISSRYPGSEDYNFTRIDRPGDQGVYRARFRHHKRYRTIYIDHSGRERDYHERRY